MAIDAESLTSDITLELDEADISVSDFGKAFESFVGLIKAVTKEVTPDRRASAWNVSVYPGSAGLGISGSHDAFSREDISHIINVVIEGLRSLSAGHRPIYFTDKALECSKNLGSLFKTKTSEPSIHIWTHQKYALPIVRKIAANVEALLEPAYSNEATVDGMLKKVDTHAKRHFVIYDVMDERSVKCEVNESLLQEALSCFEQRVEVIGTVQYRKDGMPVSVLAKRIVPFPKPGDVPTLQEIRSLFASNK